MKISEFYKLTKDHQWDVVYNFIRDHMEYAWPIRLIAVKKPQKHSFIECKDVQESPMVDFEIEIARDNMHPWLFEATFNCASKNIFKQHQFNENVDGTDINYVLEYMFENCLWNGRGNGYAFN